MPGVTAWPIIWHSVWCCANRPLSLSSAVQSISPWVLHTVASDTLSSLRRSHGSRNCEIVQDKTNSSRNITTPSNYKTIINSLPSPRSSCVCTDEGSGHIGPRAFLVLEKRPKWPRSEVSDDRNDRITLDLFIHVCLWVVMQQIQWRKEKKC